MSQIQAKRILFLDPNSNKVDPNLPENRFHQSRARIFRKYFPKYLRNFGLRTKDGSVKAKVKRARIFRDCKDPPSLPYYKTLEYRLLLGNKIKFIKTLNSDHESPAQLLKKIKLFIHLRSIRLSSGENLHGNFAPGIESHHLIKVLKEIRRLKSVKILEFNQLFHHSTSLIQAINASPRILRSLKTLVISSDGVMGHDGEVLSAIKDCKNLLKYVTCLRIAALRSPEHLKGFRSLEDSCPNLRNLSFEFSCRDIAYNVLKEIRISGKCFPVEGNDLSAVQTFQNLKALKLHIADTFTFLNDFHPPPLIQNLLLNFKECLTKEILTRIDQTFGNNNEKQLLEFLETSPALVKFYEKFKNLKNLQVLEIFFSGDVHPEDYQHYNYLCQGFLKRIPVLKKLTSVGGDFYWGLNKPYRSPIEDFYLPQLLQSCRNFRQSLETLEIGHEKITFSNFNLFSSRNKFPNLSTITLTGAVHQNDYSNTEIGLFLKQIMTLGTSLTAIKFNTFVHAKIKPLLSLLQQLNQLRRPDNLKLKLQIMFFEDKSLEDLGADFDYLIKKMQRNQLEYPELPGVSLAIYTNETQHVKGFLEVYAKKFDSFKIYSLGSCFRPFD